MAGSLFPDGRLELSFHLCGRTLRDSAWVPSPIVALPGGDPLAGAAARSGLRPRGRSTPGPVAPRRQPIASDYAHAARDELADKAHARRDAAGRATRSRLRAHAFGPRGPRSRSTSIDGGARARSARRSRPQVSRRRARDRFSTWGSLASTSSSFVMDPIVARTIPSNTVRSQEQDD